MIKIKFVAICVILVVLCMCAEEGTETPTTTPTPTTPVPTISAPTTTAPPSTTPAPTTAPPTTVAPTTEPPQEVLKYRDVVNLGEGDPKEINPLLKEKEFHAKDTIFFKTSGDHFRFEWEYGEGGYIDIEIGTFEGGVIWEHSTWEYSAYSNNWVENPHFGTINIEEHGLYYLNYKVHSFGYWKIRILDYSTENIKQPEYEWKTILYPEQGKNFTLRKNLFRIKRVKGYKDNEKLPIDITISHTWIEQSEKKSEVVRGYSVELDAGEVSWCLYNDTSTKLYEYWYLKIIKGYESVVIDHRWTRVEVEDTDWTGYIEIQIPVFKE